jgi:ketosteroid isomerase-like protein
MSGTDPATITSTSSDSAATIDAARTRNEETWRASALALYTGDLEAFLGYWTPDARYEVAYPVAGLPTSVEGRDQLGEMFGAFGAAARSIEVHDVQLHQTDNPDVIFVEERMVVELQNGQRYENRLAIRVTFKGSQIHRMFEYFGQAAHERLAAAMTAAAGQ